MGVVLMSVVAVSSSCGNLATSFSHAHEVPNELPVVTCQPVVTPLERAWS